MSQGFINAVDNSPLLGILKESFKAIPSFLGRGANIIGESIEGAVAGVSGLARNIAARADDFSLGGSTSPETTKCGRSAAHAMGQYEAPALGKFGCTLNDVQTPTVGGQAVSGQGFGQGF